MIVFDPGLAALVILVVAWAIYRLLASRIRDDGGYVYRTARFTVPAEEGHAVVTVEFWLPPDYAIAQLVTYEQFGRRGRPVELWADGRTVITPLDGLGLTVDRGIQYGVRY